MKGYVYLVQAGDRYKVGRSVDPKDRVANLKFLHPCAVLLYSIPCSNMLTEEKRWHQTFAAKTLGHEWFSLTPEDVEDFRLAASRGVPYPKYSGSPVKQAEVLRRLGISKRTFYRWIKEGKLPAWKMAGGQWRVAEAEVKRMEAENEREA